MSNYINVKIENDPYRGGIQITSTAKTTDASSIKSIVISRTATGSSVWTKMQTIEISKASDLNFSCFDITAKSGVKYDYIFDVLGSDSLMPIESNYFGPVACRFEGLFVGNYNKQYVAGTNFKTETKRNTQVEYVTTLAGKYPYRISNADTNYTTGTSSGLFLKLTDDKKSFVSDYDHSFSNEVLDFLTDNTSKVLKTHDGQAWYVSIDANPSKVYSDFYGMNAVTFNWTEIGELPPLGMVIN